jgi:hypothetical protein
LHEEIAFNFSEFLDVVPIVFLFLSPFARESCVLLFLREFLWGVSHPSVSWWGEGDDTSSYGGEFLGERFTQTAVDPESLGEVVVDEHEFCSEYCLFIAVQCGSDDIYVFHRESP